MIALTRTVRFALNPSADAPGPDPNGYAGSPSMRGLGRHYEVQVRCRGELDPATGYLVDIKDVDRAVRASIIPAIQHACEHRPATEPSQLIPQLLTALTGALPSTTDLRWSLTPYYSVEMSTRDPGVVLIRQKFDFAASHRLHVPALSPDENRRRFGKCNHPSGHGHNYQFEPCVAIHAAGAPGSVFSLQTLERLAESTVIARFDHKHLNCDTEEFRDGAGLNPTVENIARVCFDLLSPAVAREGAALRSITVWETDRTCATYPA